MPMMEIITAIAGKLAELTVDPILRQIKYPFFYKSNIQTFRVKMKDLEKRRNDVQRLVDAAENNNEGIKEGVSAWLQKVKELKENAEVNDLKKKADEVLNGVAGFDMLCLFNRCPNLKSRYLSSRRATNMTIKVDELKEEGKLFERETVSSPQRPVQELNPTPTPHEEFETRLSIKKKIKEALMDKEISIIGICGMPGVGKTTMAKEIVTEVQCEKLFDEVAFAVVSNDPDINKIQDQLAEMLGLTIREKTNEDARAGQLHKRLESKDGKSILVILDDVWKGIALGTIGIPSPSDHKGLKIMLTTRIEDTCSEMGAETKFKIQVLGEKEGWQLFKDMAGISDDETDIELVSIAKKIATECGGLPLALEVVGKSLKNKKAPHKWRDALQQLQKASVTNLKGMHELVYSRIELSYSYLKSNEDRDLLLLCSLFAEDESIQIEDLVRYARGLDLFPNTETLYETRDRAYSIADDLKSCYLLQPGWREGEVKLHDVIRDFCIQKKATKEKGGYLVKHTGLKEWPELGESCSAVSITFNVMNQLHGGLKYPNVKLLRVICRDEVELNNSEDFFQDMNELRVVELKGMNIQIPSSIQLLTGLRTLCLISCELDSQLSMIGSLKKLEILCFYDSHFGASVPVELAKLSNLKSLDLRFRESFQPLLPGVLSGMKKLEELYLGNYVPIEGEGQRYIIIEELSSLTSLRAFQICTHDTQILKQILGALSLENLEKFEITSTRDHRGTGDYRVKRSLYLLYDEYGDNLPSFLQPEINELMKKTYHLQIKKAKVLKNLVSELDGDGFIELKTLFVHSCVDFEYLMDATNSIPSGSFGKLESLRLKDLPKLKELCNGNIPRGVVKPSLFCNLMNVFIYNCDAVRSLFRESAAKCLVNLETLNIFFCPMLEEVVSMDAQENEVVSGVSCKMLEFPKLKSVDLFVLRASHLNQIAELFVKHCSTRYVNFPNMESLHVVYLNCIVKLFDKEITIPITSLHKLTRINVVGCVKLLAIAESDSIQLLQNLHSLEVLGCDALEVFFDFEGIKVTDDAEINMLGRLTKLSMSSLPKLVHIIRKVPKQILVFKNLTDLTIGYCKSLRYLFSPSIVNSLAALESLRITNCEALEEIIGREENISETRNINSLEFPNLISLDLENLSSFKSFRSESNNDGNLRALFNQVTFPCMKFLTIKGLQYMVKLVNMRVENSSKSLQNLERLEVEDCKALEVLFDFECLTTTKDHVETVFGRLRSLQLKSLDKLVHITRMVPKEICVFENLTSLVVERCGSLKYLFSPSMADSLVALEFLKVSDCESIEEIVGKEEEGTSETKIIEGTKTRIVFPNLNCLLLENLPRIQMFCSQNNELVFPPVENLTIENCPMMRKSNEEGSLAKEEQVCNE